ncbi:MAG: helix-turn-helix domain-containing protein [Deltaproteobacteria bacterium]|nr:helix-turn-helix domain-containing protein [Deltaproteobacteria bacterium]
MEKFKSTPFGERLQIAIDELYAGKKSHFAKALGIDPSFVGSWINTGSLPSGEKLELIAGKTVINLNWLLTGKGEKYIKQKPAENAEETVKDLTPTEINELVANLNQLPAAARDALFAQAKTLAQAFNKAYKESTEVDDGE